MSLAGWQVDTPPGEGEGDTMVTVRHKRLMLRLSFIVVIAVALFGGWYAHQYWQIETDSLNTVQLEDEGDWVDFFAGIGEGTIQLFLGFTSE